MTPPRTAKALHKHYTSMEGVRVPSYSTLRDWQYKYRWDERASVFDSEQDIIRLENIKRAKEQEHRKEVKQFQGVLKKSGIGQATNSVKGLQVLDKLYELLEQETNSAKTNLDNVLKLTNAIANLMRSIPTLSASGAEAWAKSLGIEKMLEDMEG